MPYDPSTDKHEPWQLTREEYIHYLATLEPADWFAEVVDWGHVHQLSFDMMEHRITLEYELINSDPTTFHTVVFERVRAVFFESGRDGVLIPPDTAKNDKGWEGATIRPTGLYRIVMEPLEPVIPLLAGGKFPEAVTNFLLSFHVFQETLNIEAGRIIIDGRVFDVGLPTPWREPVDEP
jgi:hypothetical protein